jgi:cytoskeletal protein RodZ
MPEIGQSLREARMRERIDVSEIEAQTKIRAKYLRALENEEWDLLPGPTFVKSFLRTYAQALGLDGRALVEEYRVNYERPSDLPDLAQQPIAPTKRRAAPSRRPSALRSRPGGPSRGYIAAIAGVSLVIVLLLIGLLSGGSSNNTDTTSTRSNATGPSADHRGGTRRTPTAGAPAPTSEYVALTLQATAPLYVCLLGEGGRKLIAGATLEAGQSEPTFHAKRFLLTLGNNAVKLTIDGVPRVVPASSQAIGYSITRNGRRPLSAAQMPTCK